MIIASSFFGIAHEEFTKLFTIVIQLGTVLSVALLACGGFVVVMDFYCKPLVAFLPAVILGLFLSGLIESPLEIPHTVAISLVIGGFTLLELAHWFGNSENTDIS